ncbi:hypothetical protein C364_04023 [Cryptococcus neoformans Bt63]|nr:hypothetical protein C364_04023 [Cryptococcus neoformans var. grubii Bt63]
MRPIAIPTPCKIPRRPAESILRRFHHPESPNAPDPANLLRQVMRNVAQPVAVAVASVPPTSPLAPLAKYHGATLTSFTSLTLHPRPLVAFSLRLPSRMADCLRPWRTGGSIEEPKARQTVEPQTTGQVSNTLRLPPKSELPWPLSTLPMPEDPPPWAQSLVSRIPNPLAPPASPTTSSCTPKDPPESSPATLIPPTPLTISLLSPSNEAIADALSQPRTDHSSIFALPNTWEGNPTASTDETPHPPALLGCVGSLQCQVIGSVMLKDLCLPGEVQEGEGSEMFICRVVAVKMGDMDEPLLHWRRRYAGVKEFD